MRGRHDGSFYWMFGEDTRAMGRLTTCSDPTILTPRILGKTLTQFNIGNDMKLPLLHQRYLGWNEPMFPSKSLGYQIVINRIERWKREDKGEGGTNLRKEWNRPLQVTRKKRTAVALVSSFYLALVRVGGEVVTVSHVPNRSEIRDAHSPNIQCNIKKTTCA